MAEKIAVIYARYSSEKQTYQSIEGQLKVCQEFAERNGYNILREYIDEAQTGKTDKRKSLQKMLADSKKKQFDIVIVYAFDRFGRNVLQTLLNENKLNDNGVTVLSATEGNENTPSGRLQRNMHMTFAQFVSEELAQKTIRGMRINAEKGLVNGGTTPFGYKVEDKKYVLNEKTAPIVREIFTEYANGKSMKQIVVNLNERGIKNASGKQFLDTSLHNLLKNRKYLGLYIYTYKDGDETKKIEIQGGVPQIIEQDLFDKVAERMSRNKVLSGRSRAKAEYLLTGKLFCGLCKNRIHEDIRMTGHSSNQVSKKGVIFNYYKCNNQGGSKPCKKKMVHKNYIEDIVVNKCRDQLTHQNILRIAKEVARIAESYDDRTEINRLESLMQEAQEVKENHMTSLRACKDDTVREMIFEDLSKTGAELKALEKQIEIEKTRRFMISEEQIVNSLTKLAKGDINDIVYRKSLIRLLVNKIFLYDDRFTITFNTSDEEVEITDSLLENIEKGLDGNDIWESKVSGSHQLEAGHNTLVAFCNERVFVPEPFLRLK